MKMSSRPVELRDTIALMESADYKDRFKAEYYQVEHKTLINNMKAFIEPAMIIFLAVVVGGIVMAVILPMFGLLAQIQ